MVDALRKSHFDDTMEVATTNWDLVIERDLKIIAPEAKMFYVHGSVNDRTLYLPSETLHEKYRTPLERKELDRRHR